MPHTVEQLQYLINYEQKQINGYAERIHEDQICKRAHSRALKKLEAELAFFNKES